MKEQFRGHRTEKRSKVNTPFHHAVRAYVSAYASKRHWCWGRCEKEHFAFRPYVAEGAWEARPRDACPDALGKVDTRTPATYLRCLSPHEFRPSILRVIETERLAPRIRSLVNAGKRRPHVGVDDTLPASPLRCKKKIPGVSSRSGPPSMLAIKAWKGCRCAVGPGGLPVLLLNRGEDVQLASGHLGTCTPGQSITHDNTLTWVLIRSALQ